MNISSSYIFIDNYNKSNSRGVTQKKDGTVDIHLGKSVSVYIAHTFPSITEEIVGNSPFNEHYNSNISNCDVSFTVHTCNNIQYLEISVSADDKEVALTCLEKVQSDLFDSGIRNDYIDIISYDAISEYYCNAILPYLNNLERNLRKLLFNVYILYFGENYYEEIVPEELNDSIKQLIGSTYYKTEKDKIKEDYGVKSNKEAERILRLKYFFYSIDYHDVEVLLFTPHLTDSDLEERDMFLSSNDDLSKLSDDQLRNAFIKYTPRSDWDRYFKEKSGADNAEELLSEIHNFRNYAAHFKSFAKVDYENCKSKVNELNELLLKAIDYTEDKEFVRIFKENINQSLSNISRVLINFMRIDDELRNVIAYSQKSMSEAMIKPMNKITKELRRSIVKSFYGLKMMNKSLVILAAGIGSRFGGGIKQLEPVGPNGELIIDYSIHDALVAGFNKIVFIIRHDIEADFRDRIGNRIESICKPLGVEVAYAFQEKDMFVDEVPEGRTKPWGTGHAVLCAKNVIDSPFAVINSDDYYGKEGFKKSAEFLDGKYALVGYILKNTLSDNGGVSRGICSVDNGKLVGITETKNIVKTPDGAESNGAKLDDESLVSMNFWCFPLKFMDVLEKGFSEFLANMKDPLNDEYLLPTIADKMLKQGTEFSVLPTTDRWFGFTYKEDTASVIESFKSLYEAGEYRNDLYGDL